MVGRIEAIAIKFFNAYNEQGPNPWKTFDGRDVPKWPDLNEQVQSKWMAVALLACDMGAVFEG